MKIDNLENEYQVLQHEHELLKRELNDYQVETKTLKDALEKQRE